MFLIIRLLLKIKPFILKVIAFTLLVYPMFYSLFIPLLFAFVLTPIIQTNNTYINDTPNKVIIKTTGDDIFGGTSELILYQDDEEVGQVNIANTNEGRISATVMGDVVCFNDDPIEEYTGINYKDLENGKLTYANSECGNITEQDIKYPVSGTYDFNLNKHIYLSEVPKSITYENDEYYGSSLSFDVEYSDRIYLFGEDPGTNVVAVNNDNNLCFKNLDTEEIYGLDYSNYQNEEIIINKNNCTEVDYSSDYIKLSNGDVFIIENQQWE